MEARESWKFCLEFMGHESAAKRYDGRILGGRSVLESLVMNRFADIFERAKGYCRSSADLIHLEESTQCAEWLCSRDGGNLDVVMPAIMLHDIGLSVMSDDERAQTRGTTIESARLLHRHEEEGAAMARRILGELDYDPTLVDEIAAIITQHDTNQPPRSKNEAIVKDANNLSRFTPRGFASSLAGSSKTAEELEAWVTESLERMFTTQTARIAARLHWAKRRLRCAKEAKGSNGLVDQLLETFLQVADRVVVDAQKTVQTVALESMRQRLMDLKRQIEVYILCHPEMTLDDLQRSREFQDLAVQKFYTDGYTGIVDIGRQSPRYGQVIFHPDARMLHKTTEELERERPRTSTHGFWDWYPRAVAGEETCMFYSSKDRQDQAREKVQWASPMRAGAMEWSIIATAYVDQSFHHANVVASRISHSIDTMLDDLDARILYPLSQLITASEVISSGDLSRRVDVDVDNELGGLAKVLNQMVASVETSNHRTQQYARELEQQRDELARSLELIREQQASITALSVPVIRVWEHVLVLPLVGSIDAARGQLITETILPRVVSEQAQHVFIDLTGVSVAGSEVVEALLSITKAIGLLGAKCTITGVSPRIARTLVEAQAEMGGVRTAMNLEHGLRSVIGDRVVRQRRNAIGA